MENLRKNPIFNWFYEINQIPRGSGNEEAISEFLVNFAKERNLAVRKDEANNVIIEKPATEGYENSKSVIIQGHMDMVCVKEDGSAHDFEKDPIDMYIDGDYLKARGTTLGGDDGIAVAYALAILDSKNLVHPKLTVLITTEEETTMVGAMSIKEGEIEGDYLFNIDSEEESIFLVSSAGGAEIVVDFENEWEEKTTKALKVRVSGLEGGHSGMEIDKDKANANVLSARILSSLRNEMRVRLATVKGGTKHNAIANSNEVVLEVEDIERAKERIKSLEAAFAHEYKNTDPNLKVDIEEIEINRVLSEKVSDNFINFVASIPNGVFAYSKNISGLVESSLNNAVIVQDEEKIEYTISVRSSSDSKLEFLIDKLRVIANMTGAKFAIENEYPGWEYEPESKLKDVAEETWNSMYSPKATFEAVHAGLECGILKKILPNTEMISFGPNMFDVHSPKERISISSAERVYDFTLKLLENLK
ncbi:aminoacyl-histidine dipeptidase [Peptoniphilus indolicus]|uniref:Cytosol non-specific dipeptidase n=2 Tax=Peptoniphilus indolicus TaxID=33030 RepID=G4D3B5_9FIRM|nr:aminoacyl-histidine dipeptidase [Peptoniphilus indolicus]EGY79985.1 aminoacyl-histidine dipeptidase [Peptoniphilus indolicus ATCC 29427]SUB75022.1 Cytosol non-specific dipeptidase [Peptoniphilus indolicus]